MNKGQIQANKGVLPHKPRGVVCVLRPANLSLFKSVGQLLLRHASPEDENPHVAASVSKMSFFPKRKKRKPSHKEARKRQSVDLRQSEFELIRMKAGALNLKLNEYMKAKLLGEDYLEKPQPWLRDLLIKIYSELSAQGCNLNRLVRNVNLYSHSAEDALETAERQRLPLFKAMEKIEMALTGQKPPDDY